MTVRETRMLTQALEQRWPVKPEFREALIKRLVRIIADPNSSPREITAASKALISAESQNQADEHKFAELRIQQRDAELDAIASDLGLETRFIEDVSAKAGQSYHGVEGTQPTGE